jgi:hypothetical protein
VERGEKREKTGTSRATRKNLAGLRFACRTLLFVGQRMAVVGQRMPDLQTSFFVEQSVEGLANLPGGTSVIEEETIAAGIV